MAAAVQVSGACAVYVQYANYATNAISLLGYTRNGVTVTEHHHYINVPGDQLGGDEGPPIDVQYLGGMATIHLELTKWDTAVMEYIRRQVDAATLGTPTAAGQLMFSASKFGRLLIRPALYVAQTTGIEAVQNFPRVITRNPIEISRGSKYAVAVCQFEAHADVNGVLWNTTNV